MPDDSLLLLAGAVAGEREPPARAGTEPGWHQPPHIRDPAEARRRLAEQVAAGADAIVAPAYWTSRGVLARYGEARRAEAWTTTAVTVAREAVDEAGAGRTVLVCGPITPLVAADAATHSEILAEAGVDVLLVEQAVSVASARAATAAAASTGLPLWSGVQLTPHGTRLLSGEGLGEWLEAIEPFEPARLLLYGDQDAVRAGLIEVARLTRRPVGVALSGAPSGDEATEMLEAGAGLLGLAAGANDAALRPLRTALDERMAARARAGEEAHAALQALLARAASWAPAGAALWLGDPPLIDLPAGFDWSVAPVGDAARLPESRFRLLVVDRSAEVLQPDVLLRAVESGAVLVVPAALSEHFARPTRVLEAGTDSEPAILRRE